MERNRFFFFYVGKAFGWTDVEHRFSFFLLFFLLSRILPNSVVTFNKALSKERQVGEIFAKISSSVGCKILHRRDWEANSFVDRSLVSLASDFSNPNSLLLRIRSASYLASSRKKDAKSSVFLGMRFENNTNHYWRFPNELPRIISLLKIGFFQAKYAIPCQ